MLTLKELVETKPELLRNRDFLIDILTNSEPNTLDSLTQQLTYENKIIKENGKWFVIKDVNSLEIEPIDVPKTRPWMNKMTVLEVDEQHVPNVKGKVRTTVSNLIFNMIVLAKYFGDAIPYFNEKWNWKKLSSAIVDGHHAGKISVKQIYSFQDAMNFLPSLSDFFSYSITEKSITVDPEVIRERDRITKEFEGREMSPAEAVEMENTLIKLDAKMREGDESEEFLLSSKNREVQRKRMFYGIGLVEDFGNTGKQFEHVGTVLDKGWEEKDFVAISNDIRRGSYKRGKETAIGGTIMKMLARIFQELKIVEKDCKTTKYIKIGVTADIADTLISKIIIEKGKYVELTKENIGSYIGKTVTARSPMTCKSVGGVCATCMDQTFDRLDIENLNLQAFIIGSTTQNMAMKSMHGISLKIYTINDMDEFLV